MSEFSYLPFKRFTDVSGRGRGRGGCGEAYLLAALVCVLIVLACL